RWHATHALSAYLSAAFVDERFDFYGRTLQGTPVNRERWKRGVGLAEGVMGEAIGKLYVAGHFPPEAKAAADKLVANLLEAYRRSILALDWMGEATKTEALKKLAGFRPKIGYPRRWRDYSLLTVDDDLIGNAMRAHTFEFDYRTSQAGGPVDKEEWEMYPQTVNAYYHPLRNEIVFPAAILQPPFFNPAADDAVNYGGIGAVIGHEIGHGFDDQGSATDAEGKLRNWWTDDDHTAFEARTAGLVAQYDALSPAAAPDAHLNGKLTLGENIGDLGGLSIAYLAWTIAREAAGDTSDEPIDGYTPAQRLFLNWAAVWQGKARPEMARQLAAVDPHSPSEHRCNQVAKNVPAFQQAFDVKPGDGMWLAPQQQVKIW
ncbi:MAG: peptidase M13, partial [Propionibacteriaceae bacterium]|nr:peptidase M13 [Propionibacteriaceae bacterium]